MNPYARMVRRFGRTKVFAWLGPRFITPFDTVTHDHHLPHSNLGTQLPIAYLTTTGRHTGSEHTVPLLFVPGDGAAVVVAGTNWGRHREPGWVHNLRADPRAILERDDTTTTVVARPLSGREYDRYWELLTDLWPAYDVYRRRAGREVAAFALEPT